MFRHLLFSLLSLFLSDLSAKSRVAIANLGPHQSLIDIVQGIQDHSIHLGLDIDFDIEHVNFDMTQISRMLSAQKARKPDIIVAVTTSVAQHAKTTFRGTKTPIVFAAITDPVEAKLLNSPRQANKNITGVSDLQDVAAALKFMKHHQPELKRLGVPYAQNESNDRALLLSFQTASPGSGVEIVPISIDNLHDMPHRLRAVSSTIDAIYVGPSNMIQPALPTVILQANRAKIPVYNFNEAAVENHYAFASFSVSYTQLGHSVAKILQKLIHGMSVFNTPPTYPKTSEHKGTVSLEVAQKLGIKLPKTPHKNTRYVGK